MENLDLLIGLMLSMGCLLGYTISAAALETGWTDKQQAVMLTIAMVALFALGCVGTNIFWTPDWQ